MSQLDSNELNSKNVGELLMVIENESCLVKRVQAMEVVTDKLIALGMDHIQMDMLDFIIATSRHVMDTILDENIQLLSSTDDNCDEFIKNRLRQHVLLGIRLLKVVNVLLGVIMNRQHIQIRKIASLPNNVLNVVNKTFSHCKSSKDTYHVYLNSLDELLELFKHAQDIHKKFFLILQANLKFNLIVEEEKKVLLEVIEVLYDTILVTTGMNTKTMVETWKAFTNIINQYSTGLKLDLNIRRPLKIISVECLKTLTEIDKTLTDENSINAFLKINRFYMKIVKHIFTMFWDQSKRSQVDILDFFSTLYSFTTPYLKPKSVTDKFLVIIEEIYYSLIEEYLLKLVREVDAVQIDDLVVGLSDNHFGVIVLVLKIIDNVGIKKDSAVISYLNGVMQCLGANSPVLSMDLEVYGQNMYEYVLLTFANRILMIGPSEYQQIEELLMQYLLQGNGGQFLFAHDIWTLILRKSSAQVSCELIQQFIEQSQLHHCKQTVLNRTLESTKLKYFLRTLYNNLPEENKEFIFETYLPEESVGIWSVLGFEDVPAQNRTLAESTIQCVYKKINKLDLGVFDIEEVIYVIHGLAIISSTIPCENNEVIISHVDYIMKLWNIQFPNFEILNGVLFYNFFSELCLLTGKLVSKLDDTQLTHIIKQLSLITTISPDNPDAKINALQVLLPACKTNTGRNVITPELARCFLGDPSIVVKEFGWRIVEELLSRSTRRTQIQKATSWREYLNEIKNQLIGMSSAKPASNIPSDILEELRELSSLLNTVLDQ